MTASLNDTQSLSSAPDERLWCAASLPEVQPESTSEAEQNEVKLPLRILVVDDNKDSRESMATLLREFGYVVLTASDGSSALERAIDFQPNVMLLDIMMPGINGLKVAERVRADPLLWDTTLITITGWSQEVDDSFSKRSGCDYHLLKPLDPFVLESLLKGQGKTKKLP